MFGTSSSSSMTSTPSRVFALSATILLLLSATVSAEPQPRPATAIQLGDSIFDATHFFGAGLATSNIEDGTSDTNGHSFPPRQPNLVAASDDALQQRTRSLRKRDPQLRLSQCPGSLHACSLPSGSFECLDVQQELGACGACLDEGGMDCEGIPNVENVSCSVGKCEIHSCADGFRPSMDKLSCVSNSTRRRFRHKRHAGTFA